jgi:hypothetical protein
MALKYTERPYGLEPERQLTDRFPRGARAIDSAPQHSIKPITVYDSDGNGHRAIYHRGAWHSVETIHDPYTGKYRTAMDGNVILDALFWAPSS